MTDKILSKYVFEFRYKPSALVVDKRGEIASALAIDTFSSWRIRENRIDFASELNQSIRSFLSYKNMGLATSNKNSDTFFIEESKKFIKNAWPHIPFSKMMRVGARSTFYIEVNQPFEEAMQKINNKLLKPNNEISLLLKGEVTDSAYTIDIVDGISKLNINVGVMVKDQALEQFEPQDDFPDVGLFIDIDTFRTDFEATIKQKDLVEFIKTSVTNASERAKNIYGYVFEDGE